MEVIRIHTEPLYNVVVGRDFLNHLEKQLVEIIPAGRSIFLLSDDNVFPFYGGALINHLQQCGYRVCSYIIPAGECSKSLQNFEKILEFMAEKRITRADCVIALGGGVPGDLGGFCAASFMRGIKLIQIPTSLLAAVDSSVGGKTAVNLKAGKNLVGAFWQPRAVFFDLDVLKTLPEKNFSEGIAEMIKYGMIKDADLFELLAHGDRNEHLAEMVIRCIKIKGAVVEDDEHDLGERQLLNFGHTIGHAVEKCSKFEISHGQAVAIGMVLMTEIAVQKMGVEKSVLTKLIAALKRYSLPIKSPFPMTQLLEVMQSDKKRQGQSMTLVIPEKIGKCVLQKISMNELASFFLNS